MRALLLFFWLSLSKEGWAREPSWRETYKLTKLQIQSFQLYKRGEYQQSLVVVQERTELALAIYGEKHSKTAKTLGRLGFLYELMGEYESAGKQYERALQIREEILGANHFDTIVSLHRLGLLHSKLGNYQMAHSLLERALQSNENMYGANHVYTVESLHNLAQNYNEMGNHQAALALYERSLQISKEDGDHYLMAGSLSYLGHTYQQMGNYQAARPLLERSLQINQENYGENHLNTADSLSHLGDLYRDLNNYEAAHPLLQRALQIKEKKYGEGHPNTVESLRFLGDLYKDWDKYAIALPLYEKSLQINEEVLGINHPDTYTSLNRLIGLHKEMGNFTTEHPLYKRSLQTHQPEKTEPLPVSTDMAVLIDKPTQTKENNERINEVTLKKTIKMIRLWIKSYRLMKKKDYEQSVVVGQELVELAEVIYGENHPDMMEALQYLGSAYKALGDYTTALPLFERSLQGHQTLYGEKDIKTVNTLEQVADLYFNKGNSTMALQLHMRALHIKEETLGVDHIDTAGALNNLASLYTYMGDYEAALPKFEKALQIYTAIPGEDHPHTSGIVNNLALLYQSLGDYEHALTMFTRSLQATEKQHGPKHPKTATFLNNQGSLYRDMGDYEMALSLFKRALEIRKELLGENHLDTAGSLNNMGLLYEDMSNYEEALPLYERSLSIKEEKLGENHPNIALSLNNLGALYVNMGKYESALPLFKRSLRIREDALGEKHPKTVDSLGNLGTLYTSMGKYESALSLYKTSVRIRKETLGENHPNIALSLNNLGTLYINMGKYELALPLFKRSLRIRKEKLGEDHPDTASSLHNLGMLQVQLGNYELALPLYKKSLLILEKKLGENHQTTALVLNNLAHLYVFMDMPAIALSYYQRLYSSQEYLFQQRLQSSHASERDKIQFFEHNIGESLYYIISLHLEALPQDKKASKLALQTLLQRKGRVLDAQSTLLSRIRRHLDPDVHALFTNWQKTINHISRLTLHLPENMSSEQYNQQLVRLKEKEEKIERELAKKSRYFQQETQTITIDQVANQLPKKTTLLEFVVYRNRLKMGPLQYAAVVLFPDGSHQWFPLGDAQEIDKKTSSFTQSLSSGRPYKTQAKSLYQTLIAPLEAQLHQTKHLLISPDGQLNLIPFEVLLNANGKHLIEKMQISYLSSGRDLLRYSDPTQTKNPSVILAYPNYGQGDDDTKPSEPIKLQKSETRSQDIYTTQWSELLGTKAEAEGIQPYLGKTVVLRMEQAATEQYLKSLQGPEILHIATHGFFFSDIGIAGEGKTRGIFLNKTKPTPSSASSSVTDALLRSGIVLAGVHNQSSGKGEDGVVTAKEFAALNLTGTKLVTLSACETGLGAVKNGKGVFGLRRALVLSGAESALMSLWKVDDEGTQYLMTQYYARLKDGEERAGALRDIQLKLIKSEKYSHPFYWAAFVLIGNWEKLQLGSVQE